MAGFWGITPKQKLKLNTRGAIEICWFGPTSSETLDLRSLIETYLKSQLTRRAEIKLEFISQCLDSLDPFYPIGLSFYDDASNSEGIQNEINNNVSDPEFPGHPMGFHKGSWSHIELVDVILTSRFKNVKESLILQSQNLSTIGLNNLILSIALHEVLHVLGLNHEHERPDSTCEIKTDKKIIINEHSLHGPYDQESILNYCVTQDHDYEASPLPLSLGDIAALRVFYF